jgi:hypothetical protein
MEPSLHVDDIDLSALCDALRARLGSSIEASYLRGKTVMRDAIAIHLGCSDEIAEQLVETLELQGFVRFPHFADDTHPQTRQVWEIGKPLWTVG